MYNRDDLWQAAKAGFLAAAYYVIECEVFDKINEIADTDPNHPAIAEILEWAEDEKLDAEVNAKTFANKWIREFQEKHARSEV